MATSRALFVSDGETIYPNLWATDGTAAGTTELIKIANAYPDGLFLGLANPDLTLLGGDVLFEGDDKNEFPNLWVTNGTAAGTTELTVPNATADGLFLGVIDPDFTVFGSKAVFIGQDDNGQINLWFTNGMNGGTSELNANNEDSGGLFAPSTEPPDFTVLGSEVLF